MSLFQVNVHFLDKNSEECNLLYLQKHYNIALFTAKMKGPVVLPSFIDNVNCGKSVLLLGRDEKANIRISCGQVQHLNPNLFERHHFMQICCADATPNVQKHTISLCYFCYTVFISFSHYHCSFYSHK